MRLKPLMKLAVRRVTMPLGVSFCQEAEEELPKEGDEEVEAGLHCSYSGFSGCLICFARRWNQRKPTRLQWRLAGALLK